MELFVSHANKVGPDTLGFSLMRSAPTIHPKNMYIYIAGVSQAEVKPTNLPAGNLVCLYLNIRVFLHVCVWGALTGTSGYIT